jgi:hypothetical protein
MCKHFVWLLIGLSGTLVIVGAAGSASAASSSPASSASGGTGTVTQSYNAAASVLPGMIVELKPKDPSTVVPLASKDISSMFGVVVPASSADIVLTPASSAAQQVLVATSGNYSVLVSNQDGVIKAGDYITVSALDGIGMKADVSQPETVGQAGGSFDGRNNVVGSIAVKNSLGHSTTVAIGHITVNVHLAANPLYQKNADSLPGFLNRIADDAAGQPVKTVRVGLAAMVVAASFLITAGIFFANIRTSMQAIGRNPLAKQAIGRSTVWGMVAGLVVFGIGIGAAYLILSL